MRLSKKDTRKIIRSILQLLIIIIGVFTIIKVVLFSQKLSDTDKQNAKTGTDYGFIALSYPGVGREETEQKISMDMLDRQLAMLKEAGYVTITQKDIQNYYADNVLLPEKSLFLIFEDGSRETAIYAQRVLEKYNYIATISCYGEILEANDSKFLSGKDMQKLLKTGFWEIGTNGYRFEYINYIDESNYNHYLMDYIRDRYGVPMESYSQMKQRIENDYEFMNTVYTKELGFLPEMYILMHSNTGQFGTNNYVSDINEKKIKNNFKMNFNSAASPVNNKNKSIYELTRLVVNPDWSVNRLRLTINKSLNDTFNNHNNSELYLDESKMNVPDSQRKYDFTKISGEIDIDKESLILTAYKNESSIYRLQNCSDSNNIKLTTRVKKNENVISSVLLRANEDLSKYIKVSVLNDTLSVSIKDNNVENTIMSVSLEDNKASLYNNLSISMENNMLTIDIDNHSIINSYDVGETNQKCYIYLQAEYNIEDNSVAYDSIFSKLRILDENGELVNLSYTGFKRLAYGINKLFLNITNWFIETF